jgi:hypothetical protein
VESSIIGDKSYLWGFSRIVIWTNNFSQVVSTLEIWMVKVEDNVVPDIGIFRVW